MSIIVDNAEFLVEIKNTDGRLGKCSKVCYLFKFEVFC